MENIKTFFKDKSIDLFFPIGFILGFIPLIIRAVAVDVDKSTTNIFAATTMYDLYSQKKAFFLIISAIILVIISIIFYKKIFNKKDKILIAILIGTSIFLLFTLLSAIFSNYTKVPFLGFYDRAEGFITIACYIILFIYSIYSFKTTNNYKFVAIPIIFLVILNSFIGFFQYTGKDLLTTKLGLSLVVPKELENIITGVSVLNSNGGTIYGTMFSYNYVGSFVAIILPILIGLVLFERRNLLYRILLGITLLLAIFLLFGSTSRAGIIGAFVSAIFAAILLGKILIQRWKQICIIVFALIVIAFGINFASKGSVFSRIPYLLSDVFSVFRDTSDFDFKEHVSIKDIKQNTNGVEVVFPTDSLKITLTNGNYMFTNSKGNVVNYDRNDNTLTTADKNYSNISFTLDTFTAASNKADKLILRVNNAIVFIFRLDAHNKIHLTNINTGEYINLDYPETFGFKGKETIGSARGYIWSRSIPLLKDNLILGGGPDTFIYRFPQNDLIGKFYAYDTPNMIVDKPHNLYLQTALNEGIIAFLAFMSIILIYLIDSMKLYALKKEYNTPSIVYGTITFLGVIGYLFAGLFNDSIISVAPVFWIVLGVGVSLNYMNRNEIKNKVSATQP